MAGWSDVIFKGRTATNWNGWTANEEAITYQKRKYFYQGMPSHIIILSTGENGGDGVIQVSVEGVPTELTFTGNQYHFVKEIVDFANGIIDKILSDKNKGSESEDHSVIYDLSSLSTESMKVYESKVVIFRKNGRRSWRKTIFFADVIGEQFCTTKTSLNLPYLQLETTSVQQVPAGVSSGKVSGFDENTFFFNEDLIEKMIEVEKYVMERIEYYKNLKFQPSVSQADELLKFKQLLDMGIVTQEEFDAKKKQILGL